MKNTNPIDFISTEYIINNIDSYKEKFLEDSILVFRNANLTNKEQGILHEQLKDYFGYNVRKYNLKEIDKYVENHSRNERVTLASGDDIMLGWHVEHPNADNPIVFATWNMMIFNIDSENGKTYFVDTEKLYNEMPDDWKVFLNNCLVGPGAGEEKFYNNSYKPIAFHWISNNPLIRMRVGCNKMSINKLVSVYGNNPTNEEEELFNEIAIWFGNSIYNNEEIRMVHKWKKGDLVISDMFKLAHAVTGGFNPEDREFIGMWGYKNTPM
jgi:alpha-ketoglutarate-dependent taurine dioxygenase